MGHCGGPRWWVWEVDYISAFCAPSHVEHGKPKYNIINVKKHTLLASMQIIPWLDCVTIWILCCVRRIVSDNHLHLFTFLGYLVVLPFFRSPCSMGKFWDFSWVYIHFVLLSPSFPSLCAPILVWKRTALRWELLHCTHQKNELALATELVKSMLTLYLMRREDRMYMQ